MKFLPAELQREVVEWLPADAATVEMRVVSKVWDSWIRKRVKVCCVHWYCSKVMECRLCYGLVTDTVGELLGSAPNDGSAVYYFPHCLPEVYAPDTQGNQTLRNPADGTIASYSPTIIPLTTPVSQLKVHRLLLSDRSERDQYFDADQASFGYYMRLLLKFQVKHQEYSFEHRARVRLLRAYIYNLEHRVACKLRLLLEHIGYLCIRHMVLLLPYLEQLLRSHNKLEAKTEAVKRLLARYKLVQEQVDRSRVTVDKGYNAPISTFIMKDLEAYSTFLCGADDALECHVDQCRTEQPQLGTWLASTRLPGSCRLVQSASSSTSTSTSLEGGGGGEEGSDREPGEEPSASQPASLEGYPTAADLAASTPPADLFAHDDDDFGDLNLPPDLIRQPSVEVMLKAIISVCSAQREFTGSGPDQSRPEKHPPLFPHLAAKAASSEPQS